MRSWAAIALGGVLWLGCGLPPPSLTVGVETAGADGTVPEAFTADSTLTPGAQGGFHVWVTVKLKGAKPGLTRVKHTVRRKSDGVLFSTGERTLDIPSADWEPTPAWPAFLCPSPLGIDILGVPAVIKVELTIPDGTLLGSGEATSQFACPAAQQVFCESICKG